MAIEAILGPLLKMKAFSDGLSGDSNPLDQAPKLEGMSISSPSQGPGLLQTLFDNNTKQKSPANSLFTLLGNRSSF